jgi:hypothetical protein
MILALATVVAGLDKVVSNAVAAAAKEAEVVVAEGAIEEPTDKEVTTGEVPKML